MNYAYILFIRNVIIFSIFNGILPILTIRIFGFVLRIFYSKYIIIIYHDFLCPPRGLLNFKFNIFIIQFTEKCYKQRKPFEKNMKKAFREIDFVCKDFSLNRKENELHRKYKVFGGSRENEMDCSNFRDRTKWMVPLDLTRLREYNSIFLFIYLRK